MSNGCHPPLPFVCYKVSGTILEKMIRDAEMLIRSAEMLIWNAEMLISDDKIPRCEDLSPKYSLAREKDCV